MAHLCPVRAIADWLAVTRINHGYIFRKIDRQDQPVLEGNSAEAILELFQNNLVDINIAPYTYGNHSFCHGGTQWLSVDLQWPIRQICEWGGWSKEFTHLTIVKYLISWNDNPTMPHKDFFRLDRKSTVHCYACGRTCPCT
ncbi:hypothetical protein F5146DRAFT_1103646 [Armillaria mellea]|nr:hypothetical protein F5146DRAFT_1103646 [Armillaria mellea]